MNGEALVAASLAVVAYGASAGVEVELPNGRRVSPVAAFGPAVAALGAGGYEVVPSWALLSSAVLFETAVVLLRRRPVRVAVVHALGLSATSLTVFLSGRIQIGVGVSGSLRLIGGVVVGSVLFHALDVLGLSTSKRMGFPTSVLDNARASLPLAVVMTSTAGLVVLVFPYLRWGSFAVMFLPILAVRHEFARYREARRTYHQTVSALASLTEGAGYVPSGHHARVAELCVEVGRELQLPHETIRELELVGLLHDVGAVSLPEVSDVARVDPMVIASSSGRILEETRHLAKYATVLREAVGGCEGLSLEARILRIADAYDRLSGEPRERLRTLWATLSSGDDEVWTALSRVLARKS